MNKFLLFCFSICAATIYSQNNEYNIQSLVVTEADLHGTTYSKDSTANAFFIYEKGYSRFEDEGDYNLLTDYEAKIKILNHEGFDQANIVIKLYKNDKKEEEISGIKATTHYLENGSSKFISLRPEEIYTEEHEEYNLVKFTFPAVAPGAVLTYSYQKESPFVYKFEPWYFQADIPKLYSTYETKIFGNYEYHIRKIGELPLDVNESTIIKRCWNVEYSSSRPADCVHSRYAMFDVPAFTEETFLTSRYNFISRIEYELQAVHRLDGFVKKYARSWDDVDKEIIKERNLGKQLGRTSTVKNILPERISEKPNNLEKAKEIFDFVKHNYVWDGSFRIFSEVDVKDLIKYKTGNISSINTLLHNIYENEGFNVQPIIGSTRGNGLVTKSHPAITDFNYLIVQLNVEDKEYLVDATEKYLEFGKVPFRFLNSYARLMDLKGNSEWIDIEAEGFSSVVHKDSLVVNQNGISSGTSELSFSDYHALRTRKIMDNADIEKNYNSVANPNSFTGVTEVKAFNHENLEEDFQINFKIENTSENINNTIYLNPFSFRFFTENPFKAQQRTYPIDFGYKDSYSYAVHVKIPENYTAMLPDQRLLRLPENGGSIQFISLQPDEQTIIVYFKVNFATSVYHSAYQPHLKIFFDSILDIQENTVIAIRKNE